MSKKTRVRKKMKTNISEIKKLSKEKEDENWRFRSFLKGLPNKRVDVIAHKLYQKFSSEIDCRSCSNCCKEMSPVLDEKDIEKLAVALDLTNEIFTEKYLVEDKEDGGHCFKTKPCPFLGENGCSHYKHRPKDCRSYPHLHKRDFTFRLMGVIENCSICPVVFNVYESLKDELWNGEDAA